MVAWILKCEFLLSTVSGLLCSFFHFSKFLLQVNVLHKIPLKVQCTLFFCLTNSDYINAVRDSVAAAEVCLGCFMIKQLDPFHGSVNVHFKSSF